LQAIDRALHRRVKVLQANADPVETQFAQQAHGRPVGFARVDFDAVVTRIVIEQIEMLAQVRHQLTQFIVAEKGRCAAAEMQLLDFLRRVEVAGDQLDFLLEPLQIRLRTPAILGNDLVAGAVVTNVRAERHMHVQRQRPLRLAAVAQGMEQVESADLTVKLHGRRI